MGEKYFKNSTISFILIVSTILAPLSFIPQKAKAQSISGYVSGLASQITQLPLCQGKLENGVKNLFNGTNGLDYTTSSSSSTPYGPTQDGGNLTDKNSAALSQEESIPVVLPSGVTSDIKNTFNNTKEIKKTSKSMSDNDTCLKSIGRMVIKMLLQKITISTVEWINSGYDGSPMFIQNAEDFFGDIAKNEILQFGIEINNPDLFPFGKSFMQRQATAFQNKFADNAQYSLNKLIQQSTPEFSATTFNQDFSQGGWNAWDAMTQNPQNNPLGFTLMASDELSRRLQGTQQSTAQDVRDSLQQAGGYLGSEQCVYPEGVTRQENDDALNGSSNVYPTGPARRCEKWAYVTPGKMVADAATKTLNYPDNNLLKADDLNDAVAAILDALLNNFSTNLMADAGYAGLSNTADFQDGADGTFVSNDNYYQTGTPWVQQDYPGSQIAGSSFLSQNLNFNIRTDLSQALIDEQRIFVDKIKEQNKELHSTTDGKNYNQDGTYCAKEGETCSFPGTQLVSFGANNNYYYKTFTNSVVCNIASFGGDPTPGVLKTCSYSKNRESNAYGLIPTIYQLDYCIPGPHPGFEKDSRDALNAALGVIVPETIDSVHNKSIDQIMGTVKTTLVLAATAVGAVIGSAIPIPVVGTLIGAVVGVVVGLVLDWIMGLIEDNDDMKIQSYYAGQMYNLTGTRPEVGKNSYNLNRAAMYDKGPFSGALNKILDRYIQIIYDVYKPEFMPSVTKEAAGKYMLLKGYNQMFKNNEDRIVSMRSVIIRLSGIKEAIDTLNSKYSGTNFNEENYEKELAPLISSFGRISSEMVTGDDIAAVDNTIKQIIDEKEYIYKNLIKGPNGCEKDLELIRGRDGAGLRYQIYETKRMEYPGQILYDYNKFTNEEELPDPYNSQYKNHMPQKYWTGTTVPFPLNNTGPGFLSLVNFETDQNWCGDGWHESMPCQAEGYWENKGYLHAPLPLQDLYELRDLFPPSIGKTNGTDYPEFRTGIFEFMIGIY